MPKTKKETENTKITEPIVDNKNSKTEKNSILFYVLTIITALLIVALIIGGALFIAVKKNVNGIADSMGDTISNIPVLKMALPAKPDPEDQKNMTEAQVRKKYTELRDKNKLLEKQIADLTSQMDSLNKQISAKDTDSGLLKQQKTALETDKQKLTSENAQLKKQVDDMSATIAKGDPTEFKKYFESIDPTTAANLYSQILKQEKVSADVKKYCSIYEKMDASSVATIMEQMGTTKMSLIVAILKNLSKNTTGDILSNMTPSFAAKVSEQLAKVYSVNTTSNVKGN